MMSELFLTSRTHTGLKPFVCEDCGAQYQVIWIAGPNYEYAQSFLMKNEEKFFKNLSIRYLRDCTVISDPSLILSYYSWGT